MDSLINIFCIRANLIKIFNSTRFFLVKTMISMTFSEYKERFEMMQLVMTIIVIILQYFAKLLEEIE